MAVRDAGADDGIVGGMLGSRLNGAGTAVAGEPVPRSIAAREILLIGPNGKARAALHMTKDGQPILELYDHAGQTRVGLDIGPDETPGVRLYDLKGAARIGMSVSSDNVPALRLFDAQSRPRALLGVDGDGEAAMNF